jgi:hypothetical protein
MKAAVSILALLSSVHSLTSYTNRNDNVYYRIGPGTECGTLNEFGAVGSAIYKYSYCNNKGYTWYAHGSGGWVNAQYASNCVGQAVSQCLNYPAEGTGMRKEQGIPPDQKRDGGMR